MEIFLAVFLLLQQQDIIREKCRLRLRPPSYMQNTRREVRYPMKSIEIYLFCG